VEHRNYGDVLIGMMERFTHIHRLPAIAGILENKDQLKRRLVMIKKFRRPTRREIIAFAVLFAVLSIGFLTEPRSLLSQSESMTKSARMMNMEENLEISGQALKIIIDDEDYRDFEDMDTVEQRIDEINSEISGIQRSEVLTKPASDNTASVIGIVLLASPKIVPESVLVKPQVLYRSTPGYTEEARYARIEGTIILSVTIRNDGRVDNVKVEQGLGYGLDEEAVRCVTEDWRLRPATRNGVPVDYTATIEVVFKLL